jgi:hypothetical protein
MRRNDQPRIGRHVVYQRDFTQINFIAHGIQKLGMADGKLGTYAYGKRDSRRRSKHQATPPHSQGVQGVAGIDKLN